MASTLRRLHLDHSQAHPKHHRAMYAFLFDCFICLCIEFPWHLRPQSTLAYPVCMVVRMTEWRRGSQCVKFPSTFWHVIWPREILIKLIAAFVEVVVYSCVATRWWASGNWWCWSRPRVRWGVLGRCFSVSMWTRSSGQTENFFCRFSICSFGLGFRLPQHGCFFLMSKSVMPSLAWRSARDREKVWIFGSFFDFRKRNQGFILQQKNSWMCILGYSLILMWFLFCFFLTNKSNVNWDHVFCGISRCWSTEPFAMNQVPRYSSLTFNTSCSK